MVIIMIQITEKLRIVQADDKNLALEELKDVTSKKSQTTNKQWCWCGWYGDLKTALLGALHKQLFDSAEEELEIKGLIERIEKVENYIKNMKVIEG